MKGRLRADSNASAKEIHTRANRLENQPPQLAGLTIVRFFAAIHVVLFHFLGALYSDIPPWLAQIVSKGSLAVDFFFLLSGYILAVNYPVERLATSKADQSFWIARFSRIYPAYLLAWLLCLPQMIEFSLASYSAVGAAARLLGGGVVSLLCLQAWHSSFAPYWNFPGWSISNEAFFYLTFPSMLRRSHRLPLTQFFWATMCTLILAAAIEPILAALQQIPGKNLLQLIFSDYNPLLRWPEFLAGILLARWQMQEKRKALPSFSGLLPFFAILLAYFAIVGAFGAAFSSHAGRLFLFVPICCLMIVALSRFELPWTPDRWSATRVLVWLGEISYSIYIVQWPIFYWTGLKTENMEWGKLCVYLAALILVSGLQFHYWESPLRKRWKQRLEERYNANLPQPS